MAEVDNNTKAGLIVGTLAAPALALFMTGMWLFMLPFLILRAWVLSLMYQWFLVPLGLPHLNVWHIAGILLIINIVRNARSTKPDKDQPIWVSFVSVIIEAIAILLALLTAFIIHGWI